MDATTAMHDVCAGWERLDAAAVAALFALDGRYEGPLFDVVPVGPDAVFATCTATFADLTKVRIPLRAIASTETHVLAEGRFVCTATSGEDLDFPLVMVAELRDGRIIRFTEYFDTASLG